jgi:hypothetical protein
MNMNWRRGVAAAVALIALCGTAQADILTAGPLYGGGGQLNGRVICCLLLYPRLCRIFPVYIND